MLDSSIDQNADHNENMNIWNEFIENGEVKKKL